jgi:hypothetical protein
MKGWIIMLGMLACWHAMASAQCLTSESSTKNWNIDAAHVYWEFSKVLDPQPTGFRVHIGTAPRVYTLTRDFPATQFNADLSVVVPGPGRYYLAVSPLYGTQEGGKGAECPFECDRTELKAGVRR